MLIHLANTSPGIKFLKDNILILTNVVPQFCTNLAHPTTTSTDYHKPLFFILSSSSVPPAMQLGMLLNKTFVAVILIATAS